MKRPKTERQRKELLGKIIEQELESSEGRYSDELQAAREVAMAYYKGDPRGDEQEDRSNIVSMDVADTVNAMMAVMREMLILDAELVIEPEGEQDELLAKAESDICTDVLMKDNPGERLVLTAIKDGLVLKNGALKVHMINGVPRVYCCPIENVSYTAGWDGPFQELPFFAERIILTRSELVAMGIDKKTVYDLPAYGDYATGTERRRDATYRTASQGETRDQDRIECHECYVLTDMDGDGISERYRVLVAGENICLEYEETDIIPYAMGSPWFAPHRLTGESVFDRVGHIQDSQTLFLRQWHDNVAVNNNGRYIYDPSRVAEEDVMAPKAGGGIRAQDTTAIVPLPVADFTAGIMAAMEYNKRNRTEAAGAALDMASAEAQLANKAATVASIEKGNQELVTSMVASNFAISLVVGIYEIIRHHLRLYSERTYLTTVSGQAVQIDPTQWPETRRMYVRCGMSPSQKAQQVMALQMHLQLQTQAMMTGMDGVLADAQTIYRTGIRWLKLNGIRDAESLGIDPSSPKAQQAVQQKAQQAQQMQQMQAQMAQMQVQLEQMKIQEDARQHDGDLQHKYYATDMQAETEEAKLAGSGVIELEKQRRDHDAQAASDRRTTRNAGDTG